ncbi:hypothetical protein M4R22_01160 [Acidovorax sp. GBBC 3334]|uniref:hypothetical protein n=1 Tax=unclassified Acidovorax TaxID=2684926 RepID=UPI002302A7D7|nr:MULTISPECIES: hypothetical protein [unclassified Acidovorax]MDA8453359.1 hypothetical protein [Acidovorax sp. GBBC 3334]MDA8520766.1 hypothetical protein [Acidovorax sp. NCPPB 4044]
MRMAFGLVGLLVALAVVAVLVKQQLGATRVAVPVVPGAQAPASGASAPTVRQQSLQVQEQVRQQVESLMQQPRPMPEDDPK